MQTTGDILVVDDEPTIMEFVAEVLEEEGDTVRTAVTGFERGVREGGHRAQGSRLCIHVFRPALQQAWDDGRYYEDIRDTLRSEWNARRPPAPKRSSAPGSA